MWLLVPTLFRISHLVGLRNPGEQKQSHYQVRTNLNWKALTRPEIHLLRSPLEFVILYISIEK